MKTKAEAIIELIEVHNTKEYALRTYGIVWAHDTERYDQAVEDLEAAFNNKEEQA